MKINELEEQETFLKYDSNRWFTRDFSYCLKKDDKGWTFSSYCEVSDDMEFIKYVLNIQDLRYTYELLTNEIFE